MGYLYLFKICVTNIISQYTNTISDDLAILRVNRTLKSLSSFVRCFVDRVVRCSVSARRVGTGLAAPRRASVRMAALATRRPVSVTVPREFVASSAKTDVRRVRILRTLSDTALRA